MPQETAPASGDGPARIIETAGPAFYAKPAVFLIANR
jgi:hypothetical protein